MPEFDPDKYLSKLEKLKSQPTQPPPPGVSQLESAIRGGAQGVSLGFADEATARLESLTKNIPYEQALQETREKYRLAQEANPVTYTGSEVAGGVLPAFIPTGATQAGAVASLGRLAAIGAGTGALSGLGYSEGKTTGEKLKDVAIGGTLGAALPVGMRGVQRGIQSLKPVADEAIKTSLTGFTGKTRAFLDQLDKNPEQIKRIEEKFAGDIKTDIIPEIYQKIESFAEKNPYKMKAQANSAKSIMVIPENVKIQKKPALNILDSTIKRLEKDKVSDTAIEAVNKLKSYKQRIIEGLGEPEFKEVITKPGMPSIGIPEEKIKIPIPSKDISGRDLKGFLQNIAEDVKKYGGYGNPMSNSKIGDTLKNVRRSFDRQLKDEVPEYAKIMKGVESDTIKSIRLTKQFMNQEGIDSSKINKFIERSSSKPGLLKTDLPTKKVINILEEGSEELNTLGQDLSDINLKRAIEARGNQGSNIVNPVVAGMGSLGVGIGGTLGGFTGAGIGGSIGGFLGGIAGRQLEQRGGKIAESVLRRTQGLRTPQPIQPQGRISTGIQSGVRGSLLDEFLNQNRREVERNEFLKQNQNRVK